MREERFRKLVVIAVVFVCSLALLKLWALEQYESFWALLSGLATFALQEWRFRQNDDETAG